MSFICKRIRKDSNSWPAVVPQTWTVGHTLRGAVVQAPPSVRSLSALPHLASPS